MTRPAGYVYCTPCDAVITTAPTLAERARLLNAHYDREHLGRRDVVEQLDQVTWQEEFLRAIRTLPVGREFTAAEMHGRIPDPPHHNHWGAAMAVAAHLGLCKPVSVQRSELPTTKGSRLLRWVRIEGVKAA